MNNQTSITIAICTYNRADYLRDTLHDLASQTADYRSFEVLIINNNSSDHTNEVCNLIGDQYPDLQFRYVPESSQGLSYARNRAVKEARTDVLLYIDDDVHLPSDFVATALRYLHNHPNTMCAGGRIFVKFDEEDTDWIPDELMPMFGLHDLGEQDKRYPVNNFPRGGNMLIRKEVFDTIGLFSTDLGRVGEKLLGSEEKAFFDRARKAGIELMYWPDLHLDHRIGKKRLKKQYLREQSEGIGYSERVRLQDSSLNQILKIGSELVKFAGSILLGAGYLARGKRKSAVFMIQFRIWVLKGFFKRN